MQKTSPQCTFDIIKKLNDVSYKITEEDRTALLMAYFPATPIKPKTVFDWVSTPVSKNHPRHTLRFVLVRCGRAYGTDGSTLNVADYRLPDGIYTKDGVRVADNTDTAMTYIDKFQKLIGSLSPGVDDMLKLSDFGVDVRSRTSTFLRLVNNSTRNYYCARDVLRITSIGGALVMYENKVIGTTRFGISVLAPLFTETVGEVSHDNR